jgi:predicted TIM-barrel fold metal-dependent hydrolase
MAIVDIHCHNFNADDLPVEGFVHRVLLNNLRVFKLVAWVLDQAAQFGTPGYEEERAELDRLLGYRGLDVVRFAARAEPDFEAVVDDLFERAKTERPDLLAGAEAELAVEDPSRRAAAESLDVLAGLKRAKQAVAWAVLLRRSRLDISRRLMNTYPSVELFTPMTVDMAIGLGDTPQVAPAQQVELQEKLSRLSMRGDLAPNSSARLHPFIGFDPRSEYRSRQVKDRPTSLQVVQDAISHSGFIGVKLYPPMGFRPTGNIENAEMDAAYADTVNEILDELYTWCIEEDVPITAHCNASNEAREEYRHFSAPQSWGRVLSRYDGLRLNLGHFGGGPRRENSEDPARLWPEQIAQLAAQYPHVYADVGHHPTGDATLTSAYFERLRKLFDVGEPTAVMKDRVMYGSDWLMLALVPGAAQFLEWYESKFTDYFGEEATRRFMGSTALEFLGFNEPDNKNRWRVVERYRAQGHPLPLWLETSS